MKILGVVFFSISSHSSSSSDTCVRFLRILVLPLKSQCPLDQVWMEPGWSIHFWHTKMLLLKSVNKRKGFGCPSYPLETSAVPVLFVPPELTGFSGSNSSCLLASKRLLQVFRYSRNEKFSCARRSPADAIPKQWYHL